MSTLDLIKKIGLTKEEREHLAVSVGLRFPEKAPATVKEPYDEKRWRKAYNERNREHIRRIKQAWREKRQAMGLPYK